MHDLTRLNSKGKRVIFLNDHLRYQFRQEENYSNNKTHCALFWLVKNSATNNFYDQVSFRDTFNNINFYSVLPIKKITAQGAYKSDTSKNNITHTNTRPSFKNYIPPKYTYQKAENQAIGASFALSLSPPHTLAHTQVQVTCSFTGGKVGWTGEYTEVLESGSYTERNSVVFSWVLNLDCVLAWRAE